MKKFAAVAAFAFLSASGVAQAATLGVTLGPSLTYGVGPALVSNIDLATYSGLTLNNAAVLPIGTPPGAFVQPNPPAANNNFLAVFGPDQSSSGTTNGSASFSLLPHEDIFGFTWGTIDRFNTLTLVDSNNVSYVITGNELINHIVGGHIGSTQEDVVFYDPLGSIVTAVLSSTGNAFEGLNFEQGEAPLPGAVLMFGAALLGFVLFARRRQRSIL